MPAEKMADIFKDIQEEYVEQANEGKKTFLFVYAMGHSQRDRESLKFVLNSTTGVQFALETTCLDLSNATKNHCTIFQVNDLESESEGWTTIDSKYSSYMVMEDDSNRVYDDKPNFA